MMDFTGWNYYFGRDGVTHIGIELVSQDGNSSQSLLLTDKDVVSWISAGNIPGAPIGTGGQS